MSKSKTKSSTSTLSEVAKHVVPPKGVTATGWPAIEAKSRDIGVRFRWWQKPIGKLILAKRSDGKYAATVGGTGMSIPRQVGKTFLVGAIVFALCLLRPNLTVVWTAHRLRTAEETFKKMQGFAKRRRISPHVAKIILGSGEGAIEFHNGSRILFGARAREFGRGFDEVDVLVFDEAQILPESVLDDMIPAANQSRQDEGALVLFMGTPPRPKDPGEVFTRMRTEALSGEDDDTCWIEFGADDGYEPTPLPKQLTEEDWRQISKANVSYPDDTPRESILRMRKKLGQESFKREGAGVWDPPAGTTILPGWPSCAADHPDPEAPPTVIGLGVSPGGEFGSIAQADVYGDDLVNLDAHMRAPGTGWMVAEAKRLQDEYGCIVAIDEKCPDATLLGALRDAGVRVALGGRGKKKTPGMSLDDYIGACSELVNRVKVRTVTHQGAPDLDNAVAGAAWRSVGDGRQVFGRKASAGHIDMLEAATAAMWGTTRPRLGKPRLLVARS